MLQVRDRHMKLAFSQMLFPITMWRRNVRYAQQVLIALFLTAYSQSKPSATGLLTNALNRMI